MQFNTSGEGSVAKNKKKPRRGHLQARKKSSGSLKAQKALRPPRMLLVRLRRCLQIIGGGAHKLERRGSRSAGKKSEYTAAPPRLSPPLSSHPPTYLPRQVVQKKPRSVAPESYAAAKPALKRAPPKHLATGAAAAVEECGRQTGQKGAGGAPAPFRPLFASGAAQTKATPAADFNQRELFFPRQEALLAPPPYPGGGAGIPKAGCLPPSAPSGGGSSNYCRRPMPRLPRPASSRRRRRRPQPARQQQQQPPTPLLNAIAGSGRPDAARGAGGGRFPRSASAWRPAARSAANGSSGEPGGPPEGALGSLRLGWAVLGRSGPRAPDRCLTSAASRNGLPRWEGGKVRKPRCHCRPATGKRGRSGKEQTCRAPTVAGLAGAPGPARPQTSRFAAASETRVPFSCPVRPPRREND